MRVMILNLWEWKKKLVPRSIEVPVCIAAIPALPSEPGTYDKIVVMKEDTLGTYYMIVVIKKDSQGT